MYISLIWWNQMERKYFAGATKVKSFVQVGGENTVHNACSSSDTWITVGNVTLNESDRDSFGC